MQIRRTRTLAVVLLLGALLLLTGIVALPLYTLSSHYDETIEQLRFQLQRYQRTARRQVRLRQELAALEARRTPPAGLLQGESSAIAGANLQQLIKRRVQQAGGRLESTQILPGRADSDILEPIAIRAQFTGDMATLQRLLHKIEFSQPLLFIERIEIRKKSRFRRLRAKQGGSQGQVRVTLEVIGYHRIGAGQS